jgi:signal transduction histidine kinase
VSEGPTPGAGAVRSWMSAIPTRVAVRTTATVAGVYLILSAVVLLLVSNALVSGVDSHLARGLLSVQTTGQIYPGRSSEGLPNLGDPLGRRFGAPLMAWVIDPDGDAQPLNPRTGSTATLPAAARHVTGPETISISGGVEVRVEGGPVLLTTGTGSTEGGWVVVGQALSGLNQMRSTLLLTEALVGPVLLLLVFVGALTVGRRVADPIERARRRQLEFTADASHELRTPLSVIEAEATLALSQPRDAETYRTGFVRVDVESKRLRRLVDDLLWLARFDAAPDPPGSELIDLGVLAAGAAERFRPVAERRGIRLAASVTGGAAPLVTAPPDWLDRLLGVLLDNACRYSGEGGEVQVNVTVDGSQVRLSFDDSGPGIPPQEREHIFDRFHRATSTPGGAGLGLAIGDAVVRATGGRWTVGTAAAGGASMTVTWPRSAGERTSRAGEPHPAPGATA